RILVEIEFACDLPEEQRPVFYPLQLRPMASQKRWERSRESPPGSRRGRSATRTWPTATDFITAFATWCA
ncbi:MAG: hypothetical protein MZU95_13880, partial [Desulfomicrobium escambiense]|nr:hypothetical protein [Desulfomicrobium escambiense]